MEADFSGYATKAGLKCSDGRTIMPDAFKHMDGVTVPLVWQHGHSEPGNVLGHALLEAREDGIYTYGYFNDTPSGLSSKTLVRHKDITQLSIYANQLVEKGKAVLHGAIREVSLVLSGANPGALIDNVNLAHSDGDVEVLEDEAVIYTGLPLEHEDKTELAEISHAEVTDETTVQDVYDSLTKEQKDLVHYMIGVALETKPTESVAQSEDLSQSDDLPEEKSSEDTLEHQEGNEMTHNVFEQNGIVQDKRPTLTHDQLSSIMADAKKHGSLKDAVLEHAVTYGIENIDLLFPDAKTIANQPEFVARRMEWVAGVLNGTRHSPFSRIKSVSADITLDTARAKGYVKATLKQDEFFGLAERVTTPQTVYKKQKLDRDDIIDITDLDVVAWLKAEMRVMLDEEIARAVLIGDGRNVASPDKIQENYIRPIAKDDEFYTHQTSVANTTVGDDLIDQILLQREFYRGSGNPTMYCTERFLTELLVLKDTTGRRLYESEAALATALRVSKIVPVPVMEDATVIDVGDGTTVLELLAILVNLSDYTLGADKGGAVSMFDDFDIDYNQYKYLIETRLSGALTKFKSAQVIARRPGAVTASREGTDTKTKVEDRK
jgi:Phage capsid family/Caudovirus prohead serine protease